MKCFSWSLDTVGLFARTVREVAEFASAASGRRIALQGARAPGEWTVGVPRSYPWGEMSPSAAKAMADGVLALRAAGARVVDCDLPAWVGDAFIAHDAVQGWEAARALALEYETASAQLSPLLRAYLADARQVSDEVYASAQTTARNARRQCREWLPGVDVLMTPAAPEEAPEGYATTGASTWNRAWTLLGTPALNVPGCVGVNARPMGLQLIAPPGEDSLCLAAGAMLQTELRG
jgi:Asp-tRNA(Asn)/Glu-tRNA(Gln) amidotransferase A subunit family amidase